MLIKKDLLVKLPVCSSSKNYRVCGNTYPIIFLKNGGEKMEKYYDVVLVGGETYMVNATSIQVKDGNYYFYNPNGGAKKIPLDKVVTVVPGKRQTSALATISGTIMGAYATYWAKEVFTNRANEMCPINHPIAKIAWRLGTGAASLGLGLAVDKIVTDATEEFVDDLSTKVKQLTDFFKASKKPPMKEVFEDADDETANA
jgi:hypothetical protein